MKCRVLGGMILCGAADPEPRRTRRELSFDERLAAARDAEHEAMEARKAARLRARQRQLFAEEDPT